MSSSSDYKELIEVERRLLHESTKSALSHPTIPADEKKFLEDALFMLSGIDQLVQIIDNNLNGVNRTIAMSSLWKAIYAARLIGSHALVNPISEKFIRDVKNEAAHARSVGKEPRSKSMLASVHKHTKSFWLKKSIHVGNASETAKDILDKVNKDLIAEGHSPATRKAIQHKLNKQWMAEIKLEIDKLQNCPTIQSGT
jgi:hypothetical protein